VSNLEIIELIAAFAAIIAIGAIGYKVGFDGLKDAGDKQ